MDKKNDRKTGKKRKFSTWDNFMNPSSESDEERYRKKRRKMGKRVREDGKISFKDASHLILKETGEPHSGRELANIMIERDLIATGGKTPHNSVSAQLYVEMKKNGDNSIFVKLGAGKFGLRAWDNADSEEDVILGNSKKKKKKKRKSSSGKKKKKKKTTPKKISPRKTRSRSKKEEKGKEEEKKEEEKPENKNLIPPPPPETEEKKVVKESQKVEISPPVPPEVPSQTIREIVDLTLL